MGLHNLSQSKASNYSYQLLLACCGKGSKEKRREERREQESREEEGERREERGEKRESDAGCIVSNFPPISRSLWESSTGCIVSNFPPMSRSLWESSTGCIVSNVPSISRRLWKALRDVLWAISRQFPTSMGKLYGMYCEQFSANFPKSGKLIGMYCEQFPVNFPDVYGKALRDVLWAISRQFPDVYGKALRDVLWAISRQFPDVYGKALRFRAKPFLAKKVGLHEPPYLFAIQNLSL